MNYFLFGVLFTIVAIVYCIMGYFFIGLDELGGDNVSSKWTKPGLFLLWPIIILKIMLLGES